VIDSVDDQRHISTLLPDRIPLVRQVWLV
jgi:hypothetical protein